jgi:hypothetical protein
VPSLVEFPLEGGGSVVVEVEERRAPVGVTRGGGIGTGEIAVRAGETMESALGRIQPAAAAIVERLRGAAEGPDGIEIEFGIKLSAEVGAIVAHTAGEANFKVTLRWSRERE